MTTPLSANHIAEAEDGPTPAAAAGPALPAFHVAQTNLQLLARLDAAGRDGAGLARINQACRVMSELFAGRHRGNGRPFSCHLVGAASIAADLGLGDDAIVATLLHAAYEQGRFPSGRQGATDANRRFLRERIGPAPEDLVYAYQTTRWTVDSIRAMATSGPLPAADRVVACMRLSDLLDDLQDAGCVTTPGKFDARARERIAAAADLADRLGLAGVSARIADAVQVNNASRHIADAIGGQGHSFTIEPHRQRRALKSLVRNGIRRAIRLLSGSRRRRS